MSRRLIGTLTDPSGTPLAGWTLLLDALRNQPPGVPIGARESVVLDSAGGYDITVADGLYLAQLSSPINVSRHLGSLLVAPGADVDILTMIALYAPPSSPGTTGISLAVADEGVQLTSSAASLNFTGAGVVATAIGNAVTVAIDGGVGGGAGDVVGPASSVAGNLPSFADATGKLLADSGVAPGTLVPNTRTVNGFPLSANITLASGNVGADASGTASAAVSAHAAAADPHTQYATDADLTAHAAAADPHPGYATDADLTAHTGSAAAHDAANLTFTPTTTADWSGAVDPGDINEALDQLQAKASAKTTVNAASDADITLTAAQSNAAVIDITDTGTVLTAARNVIVPARPGVFDFVNSTARALTVKTPSGSGAVVPKGARWPLLVGSANVRNPALGTFIPFADFPPASGNSGLVVGASDIGPAPGILLVSNGTLWRPVNGSAVLAMRGNNPVGIQNTSDTTIETIGPFPGGLVRSGMELQLNAKYSHSGIGTGNRIFGAKVGASLSVFYGVALAISGASLEGRASATIDVLSDTSATHRGTLANVNTFTANVGASNNPTSDFSAAWSIYIYGRSAAETAINITGATWSANVVTFTATAHTLAVGDKTTVAGVTPSGYNGTYIVDSVPTANTFTAALLSNPGTYTSGGTSSRISNVISQSYVLTLFG